MTSDIEIIVKDLSECECLDWNHPLDCYKAMKRWNKVDDASPLTPCLVCRAKDAIRASKKKGGVKRGKA